MRSASLMQGGGGEALHQPVLQGHHVELSSPHSASPKEDCSNIAL